MKQNLLLAFLSVAICATNTSAFDLSVSTPDPFAETRCGWFVNPTPANAWLIDADGEWIIGTQGGEQADGDWPQFTKSQWVKTNVNYGYGCACMKVETNKQSERITSIASASARPLSACRKDKKLKGKEPK